MKRWAGFLAISCAVLAVVLAGASSARAATRTVCGYGCDYPFIQPAIAAAAVGDVILVYDGVYTENLSLGSTAVTLRSVNGPYATRINGTGAQSVVTITGAGPSTTIEGFTITGANFAGSGGGVAMTASSPAIVNCVITGNTVTVNGGGMYLAGNSTPTVRGSLVTGNRAQNGGGLYMDGGGGTFTSSTVSLNTATNGGGVYLNNAAPAFTSCTIGANDAGATGGGLTSFNSAPTLTSCLLAGNRGANGGGLFGQGTLSGSSGAILRSTLSGNYTSGSGGGIFLSGGALTVSDTTIAGNSGSSSGGILLLSSTLDATRVKVVGNAARTGDGGGLLTTGGCALTASESTFTGNTAASYGGGAHITGVLTTVVFTNCLFAGNKASSQYGGGLALVEGSTTLNHCTVAGNYADAGGRGLHLFGGDPVVTFRNGILWGSTSLQVQVDAGAFTITGSDVQGGHPGTGNFSADPKFLLPLSDALAPTSAGDYRIQSTSPCIDKDAAGLAAIDLEGDSRPQGTKADCGADEAGRLANGYLEGTLKLPTSWTGLGLGAYDKRVASPVRDGKSSFQFAGGAGDKRLLQTRAVSGVAGRYLTVRGWAKALSPKATGGTYGIELRVYYSDGTVGTALLAFPKKTHDWTKLQKTFRAAKAFKSVQVVLHYDRQAGKAWFDGVELLVK